ncbi:hypothetical protein [Kitasatospora sp. NBC_00240]|uniref:hypothetical protein n=1 Tax=Kitasatospora sp. NBC_00240 TaxID=2903567 RepID=UPI002B1D7807|nr:hypothetical protein [Kitasatospora sp. NBC_00240]
MTEARQQRAGAPLRAGPVGRTSPRHPTGIRRIAEVERPDCLAAIRTSYDEVADTYLRRVPRRSS